MYNSISLNNTVLRLPNNSIIQMPNNTSTPWPHLSTNIGNNIAIQSQYSGYWCSAEYNHDEDLI